MISCVKILTLEYPFPSSSGGNVGLSANIILTLLDFIITPVASDTLIKLIKSKPCNQDAKLNDFGLNMCQ